MYSAPILIVVITGKVKAIGSNYQNYASDQSILGFHCFVLKLFIIA
jgi:hypothetical protein